MAAKKRCYSCGEVKTLRGFNKATGRSDGVQSMCRRCARAAAKARYARLKAAK